VRVEFKIYFLQAEEYAGAAHEDRLYTKSQRGLHRIQG
jgi:hypothetical protein